MRFSDKRYYIEEYIKCANCGVLIYDVHIDAAKPDNKTQHYCSDWCQQWAQLRDSGDASSTLPLPRT